MCVLSSAYAVKGVMADRSVAAFGGLCAVVEGLVVSLQALVVLGRDWIGGVHRDQFTCAIRFMEPEVGGYRQWHAGNQHGLSVFVDYGLRLVDGKGHKDQLALAWLQCELVIDRHDVFPCPILRWKFKVTVTGHMRNAYGQVLIIQVPIDVEDCSASAAGIGDDIGEIPRALLRRYGHGGSIDDVDPVCGAFRVELFDRLLVGGIGLHYLYHSEGDSHNRDYGGNEGENRIRPLNPFGDRLFLGSFFVGLAGLGGAFRSGCCAFLLLCGGLVFSLRRILSLGLLVFRSQFSAFAHVSMITEVKRGGGLVGFACIGYGKVL